MCLTLSLPLAIPPEEEDTCVSVNEAGNITYSCASEGAPILWRVASRQIRNPAELEDDGIFVTTLSANGSYSSTIVFNETGIDFLSELVGAMEFTVVCLVERDTFTIMEGDSRNVLIYSKLASDQQKHGPVNTLCTPCIHLG